jgi:hypothetical protein
MKKAVFIFLSLLSVLLTVNPGYASCDYQIALYDSYGDGWNGGTVSVYVEGVPVLSSITLSSGSGPQYYSFPVETGDEISTSFTPGSWAYECSYTILDVNGSSVATDGGNSTAPIGLSGIIAVCPNTQPVPTLSEWGMIFMSLMLAGSAIWMIRRRRVL